MLIFYYLILRSLFFTKTLQLRRLLTVVTNAHGPSPQPGLVEHSGASMSWSFALNFSPHSDLVKLLSPPNMSLPYDTVSCAAIQRPEPL